MTFSQSVHGVCNVKSEAVYQKNSQKDLSKEDF